MVSFGMFLVTTTMTLMAAVPASKASEKPGWTLYERDWEPSEHLSECTKHWAGCWGKLLDKHGHGIEGTITVIDDCTWTVDGWKFDGKAPKLWWYGAKHEGDKKKFPASGNAKRFALLGPEQGKYAVGEPAGSGKIVTRAGWDEHGQIMLSTDYNHLAVFGEEEWKDYGNAWLQCPEHHTATHKPSEYPEYEPAKGHEEVHKEPKYPEYPETKHEAPVYPDYPAY